jgi:hypothetical protein
MGLDGAAAGGGEPISRAAGFPRGAGSLMFGSSTKSGSPRFTFGSSLKRFVATTTRTTSRAWSSSDAPIPTRSRRETRSEDGANIAE